MPPAEVRLWNLLRNGAFKPFRFRRQVPLGRYFADFASHQAKVVIEVDGDTHGADEAVEYDRERDKFIREEGYLIVRISNQDVMTNVNGVAEHLSNVLGEPPTRPGKAGPPSPRGGGRTERTADYGDDR